MTNDDPIIASPELKAPEPAVSIPPVLEPSAVSDGRTKKGTFAPGNKVGKLKSGVQHKTTILKGYLNDEDKALAVRKLRKIIRGKDQKLALMACDVLMQYVAPRKSSIESRVDSVIHLHVGSDIPEPVEVQD